jgi:hypothetical protein
LQRRVSASCSSRAQNLSSSRWLKRSLTSKQKFWYSFILRTVGYQIKTTPQDHNPIHSKRGWSNPVNFVAQLRRV